MGIVLALAHIPVPMFAALPIWPTTKSILAYTWRNRALAARYAVFPVILMIALDAAGLAANIDIGEDRTWLFSTMGISLLVYAPMLVTWYRGIVTDPETARHRPWFTFGKVEASVVMMNILITVVIGVALVPLGGAVALISAGVHEINPLASQITAVLLVIPAVFIWLMIFTRLSLAIAFAAVGRHIGIRDTWTLTKPIGVPFTIVHIILLVVGLGIATAVVALIGAGLEALGFEEKDPVLELGLSAADSLFGLIYMLLATTLFGFIYRQLAPDPEPTAAET